MDALIDNEAGGIVRAETTAAADTYEAVGAWTILHANLIEESVGKLSKPSSEHITISLKLLRKLDTSGAWMLLRLKWFWEGQGTTVEFVDLSHEHQTLLARISVVALNVRNHQKPAGVAANVFKFCANRTVDGLEDTKGIISLLGALMAAFGRRLFLLFFTIFAKASGRKLKTSGQFRVAALVTHIMRTGLTAVPIVGLMCFVIGAIVAQQGAYQLSFYGADVMAVDMVTVLVTRDLGVLLTAIMLAGRSGSAYTAEIGSMKMREEIDALKVIGLDPVDVLLFPRIAGLIISLPLLTVVADYMALLGAQLALWLYIDMSWEIFLQRTRDAVPLAYFMMGIIKAPFMALIIGLVAMSEGLKVAGSSESLSKHTTVSVVKSIFLVIVVDGIFAVISASLGY